MLGFVYKDIRLNRENCVYGQPLYSHLPGPFQRSVYLSQVITPETSQVDIRLPKSLVEKISKRVAGSEFKSVSEYVVFVLEQVVAKLEEKSSISKQDEEKIEQRLKDLGYL